MYLEGVGAPRTPDIAARRDGDDHRSVLRTMPVADAESAFAFAGWSSSVWKGYDDAVTDVLGKRFHYANCYMPPLDDKTSAAVFFFAATFSIQFPPIQYCINHNNFFQSDNE